MTNYFIILLTLIVVATSAYSHNWSAMIEACLVILLCLEIIMLRYRIEKLGGH
jgi:hypothetical protein